MSDRATTWAWQQDVESDKARLALLLLANQADDYGVIEGRKRKEWAEMLRCSVDTFDRRMRALASEGLLKVEKIKTKRGFGPNIYRLQIPENFARMPGRNFAATSKIAASRKSAATEPETMPKNSEAAEPRLAASGAASIKNSNSESYPERSQDVVTLAASSDKPPPPIWQRLADDVRSPWLDPNRSHGLVLKGGVIDALIAAGADYELDVLPTVKRIMAARASHVRSWGYFTDAIREAAAQRLAASAPLPQILPASAGALEQSCGDRNRIAATPRRANAAERDAAAARASLESWARVLEEVGEPAEDAAGSRQLPPIGH